MPTTATKAPTPFARRLIAARHKAGIPLDVASVRVRDMIGSSFGPSRETIRRYEDGTTTEERADAVVIAALAALYNVPLRQLSPRCYDSMENVRLLAEKVTGGRAGVTKPTRRDRPGTARGKPNTRWSSPQTPVRSTPKGSSAQSRQLTRAIA